MAKLVRTLATLSVINAAVNYVAYSGHGDYYMFPCDLKRRDTGLCLAIYSREQVLNALNNDKFEAFTLEAGQVKLGKTQIDKQAQSFGKPLFLFPVEGYASYKELEIDAKTSTRARTWEKIVTDTLNRFRFKNSIDWSWCGGLKNVQIDGWAETPSGKIRIECKGVRGAFHKYIPEA